MGDVTSNLPEVAAALADVAGCLRMHAIGRYGRVGEDALDLIAEGIYDRTVLGQQAPDGTRLADLAPRTLADKRRRGYPDTIGVRTGLMLDLDQLRGERSFTTYGATVEYGRNEVAKLEAEWFQDPRNRGGRRQPPRPFFELDDRIDADLDALIDEVVQNAINRNGG